MWWVVDRDRCTVCSGVVRRSVRSCSFDQTRILPVEDLASRGSASTSGVVTIVEKEKPVREAKLRVVRE
jgi:hypothetical protein